MTLIDELRGARLVAVVALPSAELAVPLAEALHAGGVDWMEVTFRTEHAGRGLELVRDAGIPVHLGAGTVRTLEQADRAVEAGAEFVVCPGLNEGLVEHVRGSSGVPVFPGVDSTLGIERGVALGLGVLKFFPAGAAGGVKWLDAVRGPYPDVEFIPTGGIGPGNLGEYLARPNVLACGGSFLAPKALVAAREWDEVTRACEGAVAIVKENEQSG
ncbi:MAG: bifunctional 4-hydroxy-2-oxoglutarate aldolase/2-dehydro-3-deoxy-phosphogluconate aldolase [Promethearchaeota archaeon]